ncbi:MAG: hypothetical protein ACK6DZ_24860, partial [Acidobacteriota bacterium]
TNRLRLLYLAARITRHGGQSEIHFGAQYQARNRFDQLMARWPGAKRGRRKVIEDQITGTITGCRWRVRCCHKA